MMILHLVVNALALRPALYQAGVDRIQALGGLLPWLSLTLVLLPLVRFETTLTIVGAPFIIKLFVSK